LRIQPEKPHTRAIHFRAKCSQ